MSENLKIRFRLPNGEEFEAEGPQDFIENQRTYFLSLIGRSSPKNNTQATGGKSVQTANPELESAHKSFINATNGLLPTRGNVQSFSTNYDSKSPQTTAISPEVRHLWEHLLKEENGCLILRRKTKLTIQEAALLILAGAKNLLEQPDYRAILLARSIKLSGFEPSRLDRLLADEIKASYITAKGSKRSRSYALTPEGYAKAFVLAEKRVGESL